MMHSIHRDTLVDTLLNSLSAERYMRAALLATIIDELAGAPELRPAAEAAQTMLAEVAALPDAVLLERVDVLRHLVRTLSASDSRLQVKEPLARDGLSRRPSVVSAA